MRRALLLGLVALPAAAQDASVRITNQGRQAVNAIHVASAALPAWGDDRLGDRVLANGQSHTVALPAGQCVNDLRIVWADGSATERRRVNTCQLGDLVFP